MFPKSATRTGIARALALWVMGGVLFSGVPSHAFQRKMRELELDGRSFSLPEDLELEVVAGPPLIERPIHAVFDEQGRLYVTESSGTNDPVAQQLEEKPHRIWRLTDSDHDGVFDERTLFADNMMFPEGALWFDGSLYVTAPPQIWKLTDTDDDGKVDQREVWFDGKTLTHCANDLHGPYLGRDGWIYWCKGAFAEQTYERPDGSSWSTRASHIFRCRPDGRDLEAVMTGGMDNPVELVFTWTGERIFNTTFLQHPANGKRDGLIHAIYGGVYGKQHGVIEGHPRTGPLMPVMTHLGAAAPSGLALLEGESRGSLVRGTLLVTLFNMHKVTQHALVRDDATFKTVNADLLVCHDLDFHPTDVLEDADGSVLVVDTGGWYKLCCPTSQLWKPDVTGRIYRIKSNQVEKMFDDPRGLELDWEQPEVEVLVGRLFDRRPAVRFRAMDEIASRGAAAVPPLTKAWDANLPPFLRLHVLWTLARIDDAEARGLIQSALLEEDAAVRQAALHAVSLWRDKTAKYSVAAALEDRDPAVRRAAAEALGRIGDGSDVSELLQQFEQALPRVREHSLLFAIIEIAAPEETRQGLLSESSRVRRAALIALDQMQDSPLTPEDVQPFLQDAHEDLREAAWEIAMRRGWGGEAILARLDEYTAANAAVTLEQWRDLFVRIRAAIDQESIQVSIAPVLEQAMVPADIRLAFVSHVAAVQMESFPAAWEGWVNAELQRKDEDVSLQEGVLDLLRSVKKTPHDADLLHSVDTLANAEQLPVGLRLKAIALKQAMSGTIEDDEFDVACQELVFTAPASHRAIAASIIATSTNESRMESLILVIPEVTTVELTAIVDALLQVTSHVDHRQLLKALEQQPATRSLAADKIRKLFANSQPEVSREVDSMLNEIEAIDRERLERIRRVEPLIAEADVRRGQEIFHGSKAACASCHALGYLGGNIGPDLTRIGNIRSERDLLESILMPSATFVRSYEPVTIITTDGRVLTGVIRDETEQYLELVINQDKSERVNRDDIEERQPGTVSIMPAGLDEQFTDQELADVVKFLKEAK